MKKHAPSVPQERALDAHDKFYCPRGAVGDGRKHGRQGRPPVAAVRAGRNRVRITFTVSFDGATPFKTWGLGATGSSPFLGLRRSFRPN